MKDYKTSPDSKINFFKKKISSFQRKKNTNKNTILVNKIGKKNNFDEFISAAIKNWKIEGNYGAAKSFKLACNNNYDILKKIETNNNLLCYVLYFT